MKKLCPKKCPLCGWKDEFRWGGRYDWDRLAEHLTRKHRIWPPRPLSGIPNVTRWIKETALIHLVTGGK